jgi:hypothetical protein
MNETGELTQVARQNQADYESIGPQRVSEADLKALQNT